MQILNGARLPTVTSEGIYGFFRQYRFLSNFHILQNPIEFEGIEYSTIEHAYIAAKVLNNDIRFQISRMPSPVVAKKLSKFLPLRDGWDDLRVPIMYKLLERKFDNNQDLALKILLTGDLHLEETNNWGDTFWGVCNGNGCNNLGRLLMQVRDRLKVLIA